MAKFTAVFLWCAASLISLPYASADPNATRFFLDVQSYHLPKTLALEICARQNLDIPETDAATAAPGATPFFYPASIDSDQMHFDSSQDELVLCKKEKQGNDLRLHPINHIHFITEHVPLTTQSTVPLTLSKALNQQKRAYSRHDHHLNITLTRYDPDNDQLAATLNLQVLTAALEQSENTISFDINGDGINEPVPFFPHPDPKDAAATNRNKTDMLLHMQEWIGIVCRDGENDYFLHMIRFRKRTPKKADAAFASPQDTALQHYKVELVSFEIPNKYMGNLRAKYSTFAGADAEMILDTGHFTLNVSRDVYSITGANSNCDTPDPVTKLHDSILYVQPDERFTVSTQTEIPYHADAATKEISYFKAGFSMDMSLESDPDSDETLWLDVTAEFAQFMGEQSLQQKKPPLTVTERIEGKHAILPGYWGYIILGTSTDSSLLLLLKASPVSQEESETDQVIIESHVMRIAFPEGYVPVESGFAALDAMIQATYEQDRQNTQPAQSVLLTGDDANITLLMNTLEHYNAELLSAPRVTTNYLQAGKPSEKHETLPPSLYVESLIKAESIMINEQRQFNFHTVISDHVLDEEQLPKGISLGYTVQQTEKPEFLRLWIGFELFGFDHEWKQSLFTRKWRRYNPMQETVNMVTNVVLKEGDMFISSLRMPRSKDIILISTHVKPLSGKGPAFAAIAN